MENRSLAASPFDQVIGHIEDIVVGDDFQNLQNHFLEQNYEHFEDTEENKLCYTDIFTGYTQMIESFIIEKLHARLESFDAKQFSDDLQRKKPELEGEIFDLLFSMSDFVAFKDMMLDYKRYKEGSIQDLSAGIIVTSLTDNCNIIRKLH